MKKLLMILTVSLFSLGAFAGNSEDCNLQAGIDLLGNSNPVAVTGSSDEKVR